MPKLVPDEDDKRVEQLSMRLSPRELRALESLASRQKTKTVHSDTMRVSSYVRELFLCEARKAGLL